MLANLGPWHLAAVVAVAFLLFGASKLPAMARGLGQSVRILRDEAKEMGLQADPDSGSLTIKKDEKHSA